MVNASVCLATIEYHQQAVDLFSPFNHEWCTYYLNSGLPSFLKLERFVSAICEKLCDLDSSALLVYFRISRGVDTKIQVCFEQTESEKLIPIFNEIIGQYPAYFKYYSERENSAI